MKSFCLCIIVLRVIVICWYSVLILNYRLIYKPVRVTCLNSNTSLLFTCERVSRIPIARFVYLEIAHSVSSILQFNGSLSLLNTHLAYFVCHFCILIINITNFWMSVVGVIWLIQNIYVLNKFLYGSMFGTKLNPNSKYFA